MAAAWLAAWWAAGLLDEVRLSENIPVFGSQGGQAVSAKINVDPPRVIGRTLAAAALDRPVAVTRRVVPDGDVAAVLQATAYRAAVSSLIHPAASSAGDGLHHEISNGDSIGPAEPVEKVRQFSVLRRSVGIDDLPERRSLRGRRLRIEVHNVKLVQVGGYVRVIATGVPLIDHIFRMW